MGRLDAVRRGFLAIRRRIARRLQGAGDRARDARSWSAACRAYGLSLVILPGRAPIWIQYGHALKECGAAEAAVRAYRQAARLDPEDADAHFHLGLLLSKLGRVAEALPACEAAALLDASRIEARRISMDYRRAHRPDLPHLPPGIRYLILGTTTVCNASCIHCPTNKAATDHVPRQAMATDLHRKVLLDLYELGLPVHQISFGLFGDSLVDPLIVERAGLARNLFPDAEIVVNTNGAAFSPHRHAGLTAADVIVSLHCESLDPATYDDLMQPLRAARVFPKFQSLLDALPGRVHVSVPVSRRNVEELGRMRAWFLQRGARSVTFDPLSSRCASDRTLFNRLAIRPGRVRCGPEISEDLIVDADGSVLLCCQDFERLEIIGDLTQASVAETLAHPRRQIVADLLASGQHDCLTTCRQCYADFREAPEFLAVLPGICPDPIPRRVEVA